MKFIEIIDLLFATFKHDATTKSPTWIFPTGGFKLCLNAKLSQYLEPYFTLNIESIFLTLKHTPLILKSPYRSVSLTRNNDVITMIIEFENVNVLRIPPVESFLAYYQRAATLTLPPLASIQDIAVFGSERGIPDPLLPFFSSQPGSSNRIDPSPSWLYKL